MFLLALANDDVQSALAFYQPNKANFDATYDLEELLLEDNPLRARERKNTDIENLSTEMRQLEEQ